MFTFLYWFLVFGGIFLLTLLNLIFHFSWQTALELLIIFASILGPSAISLLFDKFLPSKCFNPQSWFYTPRKFEKKLYTILKVKHWKDSVPNCGNVGKDLANSNKKLGKEDLNNIIYQTCLAELVHKFCVFSSFIASLIVFILNEDLFFRMALPIFLIYFIINMLSIIIQRYNRPRLQILLKRLKNDDKDAQLK